MRRITAAPGDRFSPIARDAVILAGICEEPVQILVQKGQGMVMREVMPGDDYTEVMRCHYVDCLRYGWDPDLVLQPLSKQGVRDKLPTLHEALQKACAA